MRKSSEEFSKKDENQEGFKKIPRDITWEIFSFLNRAALRNMKQTNKYFLAWLASYQRANKVTNYGEVPHFKDSLYRENPSAWKKLPSEYIQQAKSLLKTDIDSIEISEDGLICLGLPFDNKKLRKTLKECQKIEKKEIENLNILLEAKYENLIPGFARIKEGDKLCVITNDSRLLIDIGLKPKVEIKKVKPVTHTKPEVAIGATASLLLEKGISREEAEEQKNIAKVYLTEEGLILMFPDDNYASMLAKGLASVINSVKYIEGEAETKTSPYSAGVIIKDHDEVKLFIEKICGLDEHYTVDLYSSHRLDDLQGDSFKLQT